MGWHFFGGPHKKRKPSCEVVRVGNNTSATLGPLGGACLVPPILPVHPQLVAKHDSNTIIKFADETAYREEARDLAVWCQDNNLSLNVSKRKELIVDYRKRQAEQTPIKHQHGCRGAG